MLDLGVPIEQVNYLAGHKSMAMTKGYDHANEERYGAANEALDAAARRAVQSHWRRPGGSGLSWIKNPQGAATGAVEITLPVDIVAAAYIIGQGLVDTWGD
jgi:hypothetical protein